MADKNRLARLLEVLCEGIYEKDHVMALSLLAAVAGLADASCPLAPRRVMR